MLLLCLLAITIAIVACTFVLFTHDRHSYDHEHLYR